MSEWPPFEEHPKCGLVTYDEANGKAVFEVRLTEPEYEEALRNAAIAEASGRLEEAVGRYLDSHNGIVVSWAEEDGTPKANAGTLLRDYVDSAEAVDAALAALREARGK